MDEFTLGAWQHEDTEEADDEDSSSSSRSRRQRRTGQRKRRRTEDSADSLADEALRAERQEKKLAAAEKKEAKEAECIRFPVPFPSDSWDFESEYKQLVAERGGQEAFCFRCAYVPKKDNANERNAISDMDQAFTDNFATMDHKQLCSHIRWIYDEGLKARVIAKEQEGLDKLRKAAKLDRENMGESWTDEDDRKFALPKSSAAFEWLECSVAMHYHRHPPTELIHVRDAYYASQAMSVIEKHRLHVVDEHQRPDISHIAAATLNILSRLLQQAEKQVQARGSSKRT
jgi:hypothetical protein